MYWLILCGEITFPCYLRNNLKLGDMDGWEKFLSTEETRHAATADIFSSDNSPLIWAFLFFAGFPGTNWCCVKVWVAKESPLTLLGPQLWRQPRKGIYCWTLVAGPWSKTETGGPFGPSPVGAPSTSATQTSKCTKSEPKNSLWISIFFPPKEMRGLLWAGQEAYLVLSCIHIWTAWFLTSDMPQQTVKFL